MMMGKTSSPISSSGTPLAVKEQQHVLAAETCERSREMGGVLSGYVKKTSKKLTTQNPACMGYIFHPRTS